MKKVLISLLVVSYLVSSGFAGTIFITPGAKANGMGGAYVAVAEDATAIYWNPAGLVQLEGKGIEFSSFYIKADGKSNVPFTSAEYQAIEPTSPSVTFTSDKFETTALFPFIAGYTKTGDITVATGFYLIAGGGGKWSDTVSLNATDKFKASYDAAYGVLVGNISAAKPVTDNLSLGLGLNLLYMDEKLDVKSSYYTNDVLTSEAGTNMTGTGTALEFVGAAMYVPIDYMKVGLTVRTGSEIKVKGSVTSYGLKSDYTHKYPYPLTVDLGVSYELTYRLRMACGASYADFSTMKEDIDYANEIAGVFVDYNTDSNWRDTIVTSVGADYKMDDQLSFQAGIQHDPSPYPQDQLNLLNTDQYTLTSVCLGTEYKFEVVRVNINYIRNFSDKPTRSDGTEYEYPSNVFRMNLGYTF